MPAKALTVSLFVSLMAVPWSQDTAVERARTILQSTRPLQPADVPAVRDALRAALAGKFVVITLEKPLEDATSGVDYQLDERGRIRFKRVSIRDRVTADLQISLMEVTGMPAILCRDRKPRTERLELVFNYWRGQWQNVYGKVSMPTHELDQLLDLPADQATDGGMQAVKGRRARVLRFRISPQVMHSFWIDVETLLPVRYSMGMTMDGKSHEVFENIEYPKGALERPPGLVVPDCV